MKCRLSFVLLSLVVSVVACPAQVDGQVQTRSLWRLNPGAGITLDLTESAPPPLPHADHIELSGRRVSAIVTYGVDTARRLTVSRDLIYPQIQRFLDADEPDWKRYRAYFRRRVDDATASFGVSLDSTLIVPRRLDSIRIDGQLEFYHTPVRGLQITRTLYPDPNEPIFWEQWALTNLTADSMRLLLGVKVRFDTERSHSGDVFFQVLPDSQSITRQSATTALQLAPGSRHTASIAMATVHGEGDVAPLAPATVTGYDARQTYLREMRSRLELTTPDPVVNELFAFSKIRTSESIFDGSYGPIHSPGGGNYYLGVWANDQAEYHGPFAPYLGYALGNEAALNAYRKFASAIPADSAAHLSYAFEVDGRYAMARVDRGDAAMVAYGAAHFALAYGDTAVARELWPLVRWCLAYCHRMRNAEGAVRSDSDEMEGRLPTGTANLSTSTLYYGGLGFGARLAADLGEGAFAKTYRRRATEMATVIEHYFGAEVAGLETYRYFADYTYLRHWIALPLTVGLYERAAGTLTALFDSLWTDDGVLVELNPERPLTSFWDRATLYAFRGAFRAGAADRAYERLAEFSRKRLLGTHVPYVIEAFPENDQRHLAAESALYCRIVTEGILGIEPLSLSTFRLSPKLPSAWPGLTLRRLGLQGREVDIDVTRVAGGYRVRVSGSGTGRVMVDEVVKEGGSVAVGG